MCRLRLIINFIIHIFFSTIFDNPLHSLINLLYGVLEREILLHKPIYTYKNKFAREN